MNDAAPADQALEILYDEGACLSVNKSAGILTQAPAGIDSVEERLRCLWQAQTGKSHRLYVGVPHRIDRPVSGVLVLTRNVRATQRLSRQFAQRTLDKTYIALVEGRPPASGEWCDSLRKVPGRARVDVVAADHPKAKLAWLAYQVLADVGDASLVVVQPITGRTHQIRVQFAQRGFPVVGDECYGARRPFGPPRKDSRQRAIALHARALRFRHPTLPRQVDVRAPFGADWFAACAAAPTIVEAWEQANS